MSGIKSKIEVFQRKLSRSSAHHEDMAPRNPIHLPAQSGFGGAVKGVPIPFQQYSSSYWVYKDPIQGEKATINSYRSALSATLSLIEGHQEGQYPLVCWLLQGMFNQRPLAPHLQNGLECLKDLSMKLVMLLALNNASRASLLTFVLNSSHQKVYILHPKAYKNRSSKWSVFCMFSQQKPPLWILWSCRRKRQSV